MVRGWFYRMRGWGRGFRNGIKNLWRWLPVVWGDYDWDWCFMAVLMERKALNMAKFFREKGIAEDNDRVAEDLENLAAKLRFLIEDGDDGMDYEANEAALSATEHAIGQLIATRFRYWWD